MLPNVLQTKSNDHVPVLGGEVRALLAPGYAVCDRELKRIYRRYGKERFARQSSRAIVRRRRQEPFERTGELVDVIKAAIPSPARFCDGHPAKRVFQALRIAVNDELD